jgi:arylsulfatase A-like enzyme
MPSVRVVLVILDGLPPRHVTPAITPTLAALGEEGAAAIGRAVMTSATYPNHATFVTGATPDRHGLVANWVFRDGRPRPAHHVGPAVPTLFDACAQTGRRAAAVFGDHRLVGVMGARAATYHWPPDGRIPDGSARDRYDYAADCEVVDRLADLWSGSWDLVVGHLNEPDTAGHIDGPDSPDAAASYGETDRALGRIVAELRPKWDDVVLIVLSDHDQLPVDLSVPPIDLQACADASGPGLSAIPEGSAAVVWGDDASRGAWLSDVEGVEGHDELRPGVRVVWASSGRVFAVPSGFQAGVPRGHHGGAATRDQVVAVAGGHPRAAALCRSVAGLNPPAQDWAPTIADLLGLEMPTASGRSLLASQ